jgi:ABC-type multidrug transport system fused ATPase/permease subunit
MELAMSVSQVAELGLELHVFHVQEAARARVGERIDQVKEKGRRVQLASGLTTPIYSGLAYLALLGALAVVALSDAASLSSLGAAMLVMLRSLSYGQALQGSYVSISSSVPAIHELRGRLETFDLGRRADGGEPVDAVGTLAAHRVWFAYTEGQDVLRDVSFAVEPREAVGIVGPSGSGKSTLVQLMLGLRDPDRGQMLSDGRDLRSLAKAELARRITFVPQSAHLIGGSIADNIRFMRDQVSQTDIERAARLAHLHDDITGFPEGYQRDVGERGGHLSGGQQQRLCIARALVEDPDVMIMDEPTSALDVRSEHLIRTTLNVLKERMTVIVIAHRLSTLDVCDRIMVIQDGELKGFDTPEALEASNDFYREALELSGMR